MFLGVELTETTEGPPKGRSWYDNGWEQLSYMGWKISAGLTVIQGAERCDTEGKEKARDAECLIWKKIKQQASGTFVFLGKEKEVFVGQGHLAHISGK